MIAGLGLQPRNIFCIGRNYPEHARELGSEIPSQPVVFLKPTSSLSQGGEPIRIPAFTQNVHHEVEIVIALGARLSGSDLSHAQCEAAIAGVGVGIDVTARDLQQLAKSKGLPWTLAKGLDTFAPVSEFVPFSAGGEMRLDELAVEFSVNGELRQRGSSSQMLFPIPALLAYLAAHFMLDRGDLIFTGTPPGVGPLKPGDEILARLTAGAHHRVLECSVVDAG